MIKMAPPGFGHKYRDCTVLFPNGGEVKYKVTDSMTGFKLLDLVCEKNGIPEQQYFGFKYVHTKDGKYSWLNLKKAVGRKLKMCHYHIEFHVHYWPSSPLNVGQGAARQHMLGETRMKILNGEFSTTLPIQALLASYVIQAEIGDWNDTPEYSKRLNEGEKKFFPDQPKDFTSQVKIFHQKHVGMSKVEAEDSYLENVRKMTIYGMEMHPSMDDNHVSIVLGVNYNGISVLQAGVILNTLLWEQIYKMKKQKHTLIVSMLHKSESNVKANQLKIGFQSPTHLDLKRLYRCCCGYWEMSKAMESDRTSRNSQKFILPFNKKKSKKDSVQENGISRPPDDVKESKTQPEPEQDESPKPKAEEKDGPGPTIIIDVTSSPTSKNDEDEKESASSNAGIEACELTEKENTQETETEIPVSNQIDESKLSNVDSPKEEPVSLNVNVEVEPSEAPCKEVKKVIIEEEDILVEERKEDPEFIGDFHESDSDDEIVHITNDGESILNPDDDDEIVHLKGDGVECLNDDSDVHGDSDNDKEDENEAGNDHVIVDELEDQSESNENDDAVVIDDMEVSVAMENEKRDSDKSEGSGDEESENDEAVVISDSEISIPKENDNMDSDNSDEQSDIESESDESVDEKELSVVLENENECSDEHVDAFEDSVIIELPTESETVEVSIYKENEFEDSVIIELPTESETVEVDVYKENEFEDSVIIELQTESKENESSNEDVVTSDSESSASDIITVVEEVRSHKSNGSLVDEEDDFYDDDLLVIEAPENKSDQQLDENLQVVENIIDKLGSNTIPIKVESSQNESTNEDHDRSLPPQNDWNDSFYHRSFSRSFNKSYSENDERLLSTVSHMSEVSRMSEDELLESLDVDTVVVETMEYTTEEVDPETSNVTVTTHTYFTEIEASQSMVGVTLGESGKDEILIHQD